LISEVPVNGILPQWLIQLQFQSCLLLQFRFGKNALGDFLKSSNFNDQLNQHKVPPRFRFFDLSVIPAPKPERVSLLPVFI
jgi:hypothetical protein